MYGALVELWFDGGYDPALKSGITALLAELQPHAVVFGGVGLTPHPVRWAGSETGYTPYPSWSRWDPVLRAGGGDPDGAVWMPAETDFTLQRGDGWFYDGTAGVHAPAELRAMYEQSAGDNTGLIIDIAPFSNGTVPGSQAAAAAALGRYRKQCYGGPAVASGSGSGLAAITIKPTTAAAALVDRVQIREDQRNGQVIRAFKLTARLPSGATLPLCPDKATSIGSQYICVLKAPIEVANLTLVVTKAEQGTPVISWFAAFRCGQLAAAIDTEWAASPYT